MFLIGRKRTRTFQVRSTLILSLPSPTSTSMHEQELDCRNKGKRDYTKYPQLKDDADFTYWKDMFTSYGKSKHIAQMFDKD